MRVLIVGAGMSGLSLAIFLKKQGVDVKIIERSAKLEDIGFLLFFYKGACDVLKKLGVWQQVTKKSRPFPAYKVINQHNRELITFDLLHKPGLKPTRIIKRHDLHSILARKFGPRNISFNTQVRTLKQTPEHTVLVTFSDNSKDTFDLVVGADGVHSKIRADNFSDFTYGDYGWQSMLFWVKDNAYKGNHVEHVATKNKYFLRSRDGILDGNACVAYFGVKHPHPVDLEFFRNRFRDDKLASELLASATSSDVYLSPIYKSAAQTYVNGRVVLMGDAAHAVSPLMAMGTTLALQDAFVLSQELAKNKNMDTALKSYETRRKDRVAGPIQTTATFMDWQAKLSIMHVRLFAHMPGPLRQRLSDRMVRRFADLQSLEA